MAITQTGSVLEFSSNSNATNFSTTITVPADAEIVIACVTGYPNDASAAWFSGGGMTFTKGATQVAMTSATSAGNAVNTAFMGGMFYLVGPDTGANKTLAFDWAGTSIAVAGTKCAVTFWTGIDTASPVRDADGVQVTGGAPFTTPTLTAQSGDLILAWAFASAGSEGTANTWSNLTLLSQVAVGNGGDGALATGSPTGDTTVALSTESNWDDGGIVAVVLKPAAAAGQPIMTRWGGVPFMGNPNNQGRTW